ncbi:MAG: malonate decarboxylase holo-[acyl-carrier-protein] synthase [Herminiimonas sp.]|nr:malonate decarboxylase holo-[acyl-carrier-protein] synthase [Herminiimonas sp.]
MTPPGRHALVWLSANGWESVQLAHRRDSVAVRDALARWRDADWPLVVRRRSPDEPAPDHLRQPVPVGLALPPHPEIGVKPRIAAMVEQADIVRTELPTPLADVLPVAPPQWRAGLLALHMESMESPLPLRVFGSLAWQSITGMPYLRSTSDIDLLLAPRTLRDLERGMDLLQRHGASLPLDGEVVFPSGAAVAWKELRDVLATGVATSDHDRAARVLVKTSDSVALMTCAALLASLDG